MTIGSRHWQPRRSPRPSIWAAWAALTLGIASIPPAHSLAPAVDPCTAVKDWAAAQKNPPAQQRPSIDRAGLQNEIEIFKFTLASPSFSDAQKKRAAEHLATDEKALAIHDEWDAYEAKRTASEEAKKAADDELAAAQGVFNAEAQRIKQKKDALANQPRDASYFQTVREVKADALSVFQNLRKRLLPYECFPDVASFIKDKLDKNIQRFQPQTTALADAGLDDELFAMLELPTAEEMLGPGGPEGEGITEGRGVARGQWSMACSSGKGVEETEWTEAGTFQLTILANGTISGDYTTEGGQWPVAGSVGLGGAASGGGADPSGLGSFEWGGTLAQASPGAPFTGSGSVSFRSNDGDMACGGTWITD
jgi:hypothetical protein